MKHDHKAELKKKQAEYDKARRELAKAQQANIDAVVTPRLKALIGCYLIYRNSCYSCPSKPSDYWDVHAKVVAVDGTTLNLVEIQVDSRGKAQIRTVEHYCITGEISSGWALSTKSVYEKELRRVKKILGL